MTDGMRLFLSYPGVSHIFIMSLPSIVCLSASRYLNKVMPKPPDLSFFFASSSGWYLFARDSPETGYAH